jgi:hypothetical protein
VFENKSIVLGPLLFGNGSTWGPLPYIVKFELGPKWFYSSYLFFFLFFYFLILKFYLFVNVLSKIWKCQSTIFYPHNFPQKILDVSKNSIIQYLKGLTHHCVQCGFKTMGSWWTSQVKKLSKFVKIIVFFSFF